MSPPLRQPVLLRAALLTGLIALLVTGFGPGDEAPRPTRLTGESADDDRLAALLVESVAPTALLRDAGDDPSERELQTLAAAAERAPLFIELPPDRPRLRVAPPEAPLVDRYAAIRFVATGTPADTVTARLVDPGGATLDSTRVVADTAGAAAGAFRVRPGQAGWKEWRVAVEGAAVAEVGAWVADAPPPRVLVVAGPPTWESRYAVRALERSGVEVSLVQSLGRDNVITAGGAVEEWASERSLGGYDVAVLLPGAAVDAGAIAALDDWVAAGNGVLAASDAAGRLGLGRSADDGRGADGNGGGRILRGDSLDWAAPPEIAPLPAADVEVSAIVTSDIRPGVTVAARSAAGDPVLVLAPLGRGRAAGSGLRESWRWAMDAGLEAEHRVFWRSLVDWLAAPSADSLAVRVEPSQAGIGTTVNVDFARGALEVERPGGGLEPLAAGRVGGQWRARFVAVDTGVHALRAGGSTVAAFRAPSDGEEAPAELARARLALIAAASGGAALEPAAFRARVAELGGAGDIAGGWLVWSFAALVLLAVAEWALRRLRGLP